MRIEIEKSISRSIVNNKKMNCIFLFADGEITIYAREISNPYIEFSSKSGTSILYEKKRKIFTYEDKNQNI
jgi:hypothetical protein